MANPELAFQSQIIDAVRERGGFGLKLSNRFIAGVPDLLLYDVGNGEFLVEVKLVDLPVKPDTLIKSGITALQKDTLTKWMNAGGKGGLVIAHRTPRQDHILATSNLNWSEPKGSFLEFALVRKFRQPLSHMIGALLMRLQ